MANTMYALAPNEEPLPFLFEHTYEDGVYTACQVNALQGYMYMPNSGVGRFFLDFNFKSTIRVEGNNVAIQQYHRPTTLLGGTLRTALTLSDGSIIDYPDMVDPWDRLANGQIRRALTSQRVGDMWRMSGADYRRGNREAVRDNLYSRLYYTAGGSLGYVRIGSGAINGLNVNYGGNGLGFSYSASGYASIPRGKSVVKAAVHWDAD